MSEDLDKSTSAKVAHLSRIKLGGEGDALAEKLNTIVHAFEAVGKVKITHDREMSPPVGRKDLREDLARESLGQEQALKTAPQEFNGHFRVPAIIQ